MRHHLRGDVVQPDPEQYLAFAKQIAGFWASKWWYATDDIIAVAYLALVQACKTWPGTGNLEGWIRRIIDRDIEDYLYSDYLIPIPRSTLALKQKQGEPLDRPVVNALPETIICNKLNQLSIDTIIGELKLTDLEKRIVYLRLEGHNLQRIADLLNMRGPTNVIYYLRKIQEKHKRWQRDSS